MFELAVVGVPIAVVGIIFLVIVSPRVLPGLVNPICQFKDGDHLRYLAELKIHEPSKLVGLQPREVLEGRFADLEVIELISRDRVYQPLRDRSNIEALRSERDHLIIEDVYEELVHKRKAVWAVINFICMIGTAALGLAGIMTCALIAAFLMIITGCIQMRDVYRALQGDVLLLIAGTIALTSISTQILSNNATAVLLLPMAVSTALGIVVCFGASACFASPLGYQTNLMVFAPDGYRFLDYFRLGIPLNLFVVAADMFLIPLFWPL